MSKNQIYPVIVFLIFLCIHPVDALSAGDASNVVSDFSYEIFYPENQKDKNLGYYDLLMKRGEEQQIQLQLNNASDQPMLIAIAVNSAKTNGYGVIEYGPSELEKDKSLTVDLAEIVKGPKEVTIPANGNEVVTLTIALSTTYFEGYLAGGIQLKPVVKNNIVTTNNSIQNKVAFLIGLLIRENDVQKIKPELQLNNVSLKLRDGGYSVFVNLSNVKGAFLENMEMSVQITETGKNVKLYELKKDQMRMAPNSMINFPIPLDRKRVNAREYTANIQIKTAGGNWNWMENFKLSKIEAQRINKQIADSEENQLLKFWWLIILLPLLIGGYVVLRKKFRIK